MYHVEMRMGMQVVREFNLSEQRLWVSFLAPLMADQEFTFEGHEFSPRQTRLKVYEGPELRSDQLGMGRGWQNVERSAADVTERVLTRAREHAAVRQPPGVDLLPERLLGLLRTGPVGAGEVLATAAELMPGSGDAERLDAARRAVWALLERDAAQLTPSGR